MAELLKNNNVVVAGKVIGKIEIDGGVFVGLNFVTRKSKKFAFVEDAMAWFNTK